MVPSTDVLGTIVRVKHVLNYHIKVASAGDQGIGTPCASCRQASKTITSETPCLVLKKIVVKEVTG